MKTRNYNEYQSQQAYNEEESSFETHNNSDNEESYNDILYEDNVGGSSFNNAYK